MTQLTWKELIYSYIHANYAECDAVISIPEGEILNGEMPNKKLNKMHAVFSITIKTNPPGAYK